MMVTWSLALKPKMENRTSPPDPLLPSNSFCGTIPSESFEKGRHAPQGKRQQPDRLFFELFTVTIGVFAHVLNSPTASANYPPNRGRLILPVPCNEPVFTEEF